MTEQEREIEKLEAALRRLEWKNDQALLKDLENKVATFTREAGVGEEVQADISELMRLSNKLGCRGISVLYDMKTGKQVRM